jgi:hypothetical protein
MEPDLANDLRVAIEEIARLQRRVAVLEDVIRDNLEPGETAPLYDMIVTGIHTPGAI